MSTDDQISTLVLQEFRLRSAGDAVDAASIVAAFAGGLESSVPLLTSIDDKRDVAVVRALHAGEKPEGDPAQRAALEPLVASWQPLKQYGPRITEHSESPPSYYRLAVTESGINDAASDSLPAIPRGAAEAGAATSLSLLWVGAPLGTYAGLLILLGEHEERPGVRPDSREFPLPLSRPLGVRIYESLP
jgi:hypothetical protein